MIIFTAPIVHATGLIPTPTSSPGSILLCVIISFMSVCVYQNYKTSITVIYIATSLVCASVSDILHYVKLAPSSSATTKM